MASNVWHLQYLLNVNYEFMFLLSDLPSFKLHISSLDTQTLWLITVHTRERRFFRVRLFQILKSQVNVSCTSVKTVISYLRMQLEVFYTTHLRGKCISVLNVIVDSRKCDIYNKTNKSYGGMSTFPEYVKTATFLSRITF